MLVEEPEIHVRRRERAQRGELFRPQQPALDQRGQINQVRIAGDGGKALVGGIAIAGRPQRANLPVAGMAIAEN